MFLDSSSILFSLVGINTKLFQNELCTIHIPVYCSILHNISKNPITCGPLQHEESCFNRPYLPLPLRERRSMVDLLLLIWHCWTQLVLEHPQRKGFIRRYCFRGAWLGSTTHTVATVLVVVIVIAEKRRDNDLWSEVEFPVEKSPNKIFQLWKVALRSVVPVGSVQDQLGIWLHQGYKIWDWRYDIENCRLLYLKGKSMDVYVPSNLPGTRNTPNRWIRRRIDKDAQDQGKIFTVRDVGLTIKAVESMSNLPGKQIMPDRSWESGAARGCGNLFICTAMKTE